MVVSKQQSLQLTRTVVIDDVVHYCVANMPGAVPYTSTIALTNATLPYALQLAGMGWKDAVKSNHELWLGLNFLDGHIVFTKQQIS